MNDVSIEGLDRAEVLAALYNRARPLGLGFLHYTPEPMSADEARELLKQTDSFDYLKGRVMKVSLREGGSNLSVGLYDRDNGTGAADTAIKTLRNRVAVASLPSDEKQS